MDKLVRGAINFPGNSNIQGGYFPNSADLAVFADTGTADANPMSPGKGNKSPFHILLMGMNTISANTSEAFRKCSPIYDDAPFWWMFGETSLRCQKGLPTAKT